MTKATYQPFIEIDNFIAAGGYAVYIQNPTSDSINKYQTSLLNEQSANTDEFKKHFYSVALYGLNESLKSDYKNPKLMLSFNAINELCAVLFYYEVTDMGDPFHWAEAWASKYSGSGSILLFLQTEQSAQMNFYCADNTNGINNNSSPYINEAMEKRPYRSKDPDTKWNKITVAEIQMAARIILPQSQYLPNFAKIVDTYPKTDAFWRYDYNTKTWVDTVLNPQDDYGTPPVFEPDTFYKFDYNSRNWVPNAVTLMDSFQ